MNKKRIDVSLIANLLTIAFLIVCCFLPFGTGITITLGDTSRSYGSAFSFLFRGTLVSGVASYQTKNIAVLPLIGYLFVLLSLLLFVTSFLKTKSKRFKPVLRLLSFVFIITFSVM